MTTFNNRGDGQLPRNTQDSFLIRTIQEQKEDGFWTITSEDLPGLFLAGKDLFSISAEVPEAIKMLFSLNHNMAVDVKMAVDPVGRGVPPAPEEYFAIPNAA